MKKFLLVISCLILMLTLCACELSGGIVIDKGGITKGSNVGLKPVVSSNSTQSSTGGNNNENSTG